MNDYLAASNATSLLDMADGGMWKLAARNAVKTYLRNAMAEEVYKEQVIVTL